MNRSSPSPGPPLELPPGLPGAQADELTAAALRRAVDDGIRRYFTARRACVTSFAGRHFSLRGSLALHRAALGWDVLRAPANLLLAGPHVAVNIAGAAAGRLGAQRLAQRLKTHSLLLHTSVSRRIEWLVFTELLELPFQQDGREKCIDIGRHAEIAEKKSLTPCALQIRR